VTYQYIYCLRLFSKFVLRLPIVLSVDLSTDSQIDWEKNFAVIKKDSRVSPFQYRRTRIGANAGQDQVHGWRLV
jgi:hypothetical protein